MIRIELNGIVQGVGFRPFVYNLARSLDLHGYVLNSSKGVEIELEGTEYNLVTFLQKLHTDLPPAAVIEQQRVEELPDKGYSALEIRKSKSGEGLTFISPDLSICSDCIEELNTSSDQRYTYSFINCTNCGPRYSIIENTPYDRPATSMKDFEMCEYCRKEYEDPTNRRFHAQPIACPDCGPVLTFLDSKLNEVSGDPIENCLQAIKEGKIVGIKGIGGFHIACDATNEAAVDELRRRKNRPAKPFAVMCSSQYVGNLVICTDRQLKLLNSPAAPIILLPKRADSPVVEAVAPLNPNLGVFVPYAPHHYRIFNGPELYLVMTSGNVQDEPIAIEESDLALLKREGLEHNRKCLCDYFLSHNRQILNRNDDSVILSSKTHDIFLRRSRGYIPSPFRLPVDTVPTLGAGAEMKVVFALSNHESLYLSPYIGNNNSKATADFYEETFGKYRKWFRIEPELVACDLQPDFLTTRFAESLGKPLIRTQHHHAHIAAVMGEKMLNEPVIGVSYDGTGYGTDGAIWGGEIFCADYSGYSRRFHLSYMPLPGVDAAVTYPVRIAYAYLQQCEEDADFLSGISDLEKKVIHKQLVKKFNLFLTSSMGRLFDCVAAMMGLFPVITFEAQSAMALEFLCSKISLTDIEPYPYMINGNRIEVVPLLSAIRGDVINKVSREKIALRFHRTIVEFTMEAVYYVARETGLGKVVLSGGVMQNMVLLNGLIDVLQRNNFTVFYSSKLPSNDGAIAAGQALIANYQIRN